MDQRECQRDYQQHQSIQICWPNTKKHGKELQLSLIFVSVGSDLKVRYVLCNSGKDGPDIARIDAVTYLI